MYNINILNLREALKLTFDKGRFKTILTQARGTRTNEDYARSSNVSRAYISAYMNGKRDEPPSPDIIRKLADKAFNGVTYEDFMEAAGHFTPHRYDDLTTEWYPNPDDRSVSIPILGYIHAGIPMVAEQNIIGYATIPENQHSSGPGSYFFLKVKGDSMINSRIQEGDLVLVHRQPNVENGEIAVVLINNEEATVKRVYYDHDNKLITIKPDNPKYEPRTFTFKQAAELPIEIIGKVVEVRFKF